MKKFLLFTLKRFIPFFAISAAIFTSVAISVFSAVDVSQEYLEREGELMAYRSDTGPNTIIIIMAILLFLFTAVAPIIANAYRNSLRSADFYNQIGKGHKNVRLINNLTLLIATLVSFTTAFILGVIILAIKDAAVFANGETREVVFEVENAYRITKPFMYHFAYFIPVYLLLLVGAVINYFISYFFVTRANNVLNSIIILVLGHFILFIGLITPIWYIRILTSENFSVQYLGGVKTPSMISIVATAIYLFKDLLRYGSFNSTDFAINNGNDVFGSILAIVSILLFVLFGIYCIRLFLKEKESSGELAGKPVGRDNYQMIIFHIGAGLVGLWQLSLGSSNALGIFELLGIISFIPTIISYGALYYVFYGLIRRNFRLSKKDLKILLPVLLINIALGVTCLIISNSFTIVYE